MDCLDDGGEGGHEYDAGEKKRNVMGPDGLVHGGVDVFGENGDEHGHGVGGREAVCAAYLASDEVDYGGDDSVDAVAGEYVGK